MSQTFYCKCEERERPPAKRRWVVTHRKHHHSAFNGYHRTPSHYSTVVCLNCDANGRTAAGYVELLPDGEYDHGTGNYKKI